MNTEYIYLSHVIDEFTPSYGNRDNFTQEELSSIIKGGSANSSKWIFSSNHLGTHIDVPKHFFDDGQDILSYHAGFWIFRSARVIDIECSEGKIINQELFEKQLSDDIDLLMIRTGYEKYRKSDKYWNDNPGLSPDLADYLRNKYKNLRAIGFDFISLTSWNHRDIGKQAHKCFLDKSSPLLIIEDMSLQSLKGNIQNVTILPMRVRNSNGSPVTVIAKVV
ncbi:MAG: cyclase family protein [Bacteroidota bacterium]|jgi:kynurenine formamidase